MIVRLLSRRSNAIQSLSATCRSTPTPFIRNHVRRIHAVPSLLNLHELNARGIPGLLTPAAFKIAWEDYMSFITDGLNAVTAGTPRENMSPKNLVVDLARSPVHAHAFNMASMAFNNHFFFASLNTDPNIQSVPTDDLLDLIDDSFSSLDTLRETFLTTAEAMFGPGFVWLVQSTEHGERRPLHIVPTYLAGSPLSGAHYRKQSRDMNTENPDSFLAQVSNTAGAFGAHARTEDRTVPKKALGGIDIVPLMCVSTWEHVYLTDYGVRGKRQYLEKWWNKINWNEVRDRATITPKTSYNRNRFEYGPSI